MHKFALALIVLVLPMGTMASTIQSALPGAKLRGTATFRHLGFSLYDAQLFTPSGIPLDWNTDFGIELTYLRNLSRYDLVESTMRELSRMGTPLPMRVQLESCFRDVRKGDRFAAISKGANQIGFWFNGAAVCTLKHPGIKTGFMSIFLGDNTRSKSFTRKLKGE